MVEKKAEIDKSFVVLIVAIGFVIGGLIAIPISNFFLGDNGTKFDANGQIGDFVGGLLNPVIALLALIWVRRGVQSQERELLDSKEALRLSAEAQRKQVRIAAITALLVNVSDELERSKLHKQSKEKSYVKAHQEYEKYNKDKSNRLLPPSLRQHEQLLNISTVCEEEFNKASAKVDELLKEKSGYLAELKVLVKG